MVMELTEEQVKIMEGKICPYCKAESEHVNSSVIYGTDYGMMYLCRPCDAYVGCHKKNPSVSKGRLANKSLRKIKIEAHEYFDKIWKLKVMDRSEAYKWLSDVLNLPPEYTHIGMMGEKKAKDVVYFSKQLLNDNRRLDLDFGAEPVTPYFDLD
jgi:hypothetical protein